MGLREFHRGRRNGSVMLIVEPLLGLKSKAKAGRAPYKSMCRTTEGIIYNSKSPFAGDWSNGLAMATLAD